MPVIPDNSDPFENFDLDNIFDELDAHGFAVVDDVYPHELFSQMREECLCHLDQFREAAIQNGRNENIRSDHILWLSQEMPTAYQHIQTLEQLGQALNRAFYLGIKNVEAHFACYHQGEFYAKHRDNPQQKNHRVISTVFYLQEQWSQGDGGELRIEDKHLNWHTVEPKPNRLVIFQSDLLHEVLVANQQRLSITAWLRDDNALT